MNTESVKLKGEWKKILIPEFEKPYMQNLKTFLKSEYDAKESIYPKGSEFFAAFNHTPLDKVKVVIIGQDPYHGPGQAHGLCFSVRPGVRVPPSLVNIYKEMKSDLKLNPPKHGCLTRWADQGVLLLNATLSVRAGQAGSHQKKGWEEFTDAAIAAVNEKCKEVVFILWGSYAQKKGAMIDRKKHYVISSPHPSPLSAHRGFLGSRPFSKANDYLEKHGKEPVDWSLPEEPPIDSLS